MKVAIHKKTKLLNNFCHRQEQSNEGSPGRSFVISQDDKFDEIIPSPLGYLGIKLFENKLASIEYLHSYPDQIETIQASTVKQELDAFFQNPQHIFTLALHLYGTPFQQKVWEALRQIPPNQLVTYQQLADQLNTSPRAIGNACRANPIPIIIPCHRVIAKNHLGGYAGATDGRYMEIKKWLLNLESTIHTNSLNF